MPAMAIQTNAFVQWRCTKGANRGRNLRLGAFVSVSLGFKFGGTTSLPFKSALPATALCRGRLRRFSVPEPIVLFFTNVVAVALFKLFPVAVFTNEAPWVALLVGLRLRGCTLTGGALATTAARAYTSGCHRVNTLRPRLPCGGPSADCAEKRVGPATPPPPATTTLVFPFWPAPFFPPPEVGPPAWRPPASATCRRHVGRPEP